MEAIVDWRKLRAEPLREAARADAMVMPPTKSSAS